MEKYNYLENVKNDVKAYIEGHLEDLENRFSVLSEETRDEYSDYLYDTLFVDDSVTGNASGSYTCNAWEAEENVCHNWDLVEEAANEFDLDAESLGRGAEFWDVTIRLYLLNRAISDVLADMIKNK